MKTKTEIILETVEYYKTHPRAVKAIPATKDTVSGAACVYGEESFKARFNE